MATDQQLVTIGKLEAKVEALEKFNDEHRETTREFKKWKNIILGMIIAVGWIATLASWLINQISV